MAEEIRRNRFVLDVEDAGVIVEGTREGEPYTIDNIPMTAPDVYEQLKAFDQVHLEEGEEG